MSQSPTTIPGVVFSDQAKISIGKAVQCRSVCNTCRVNQLITEKDNAETGDVISAGLVKCGGTTQSIEDVRKLTVQMLHETWNTNPH